MIRRALHFSANRFRGNLRSGCFGISLHYRCLHISIMLLSIVALLGGAPAAPPNTPDSPQPANQALHISVTPKLSWKSNPAMGDLYALVLGTDMYRLDTTNGRATRLYQTGSFDVYYGDMAWDGTAMFMGQSFYGDFIGVDISTGVIITGGVNSQIVWAGVAADRTDRNRLYSLSSTKSDEQHQNLYIVDQKGAVTPLALRVPIPWAFGLTCDGSGPRFYPSFVFLT